MIDLSQQTFPFSIGEEIKKAVVIGAGTMGSGIAAHLTNAGVDVYLLDIIPKEIIENGGDRDGIAKAAIQRMLKAVPATDPLNAGFMNPDNAQRMTPGNIDDHLEEAVRDADWIVEVVIENIDIKQSLFTKIEALKKTGAIVSSNTSTIPLKTLVEGRSDEFKKHFVITHFFNPPRFMHLLEIVVSEETDPETIRIMREFGDAKLGKNVLVCKDTPAFLANRIGIYFMFRAISETIEKNIPIEEADAVLGKPIGFPKEGIFGLLDLVGIGILPHVTESLLQGISKEDPFCAFDHEKGLALIHRLLSDGRGGRKSPKGGFYRMQKSADGTKQKQALNLETDEYYDLGKLKLENVKNAKTKGPRAVFEHPSKLAQFAWVVVRDTLLYAASLVPEIADDLVDIDRSLHGGYNAKWGPFELIDQLGVEWFCNRVISDGIELPPTLQIAKNRSFYKEIDQRLCRLVFDFEKNTADYAPWVRDDGVLVLTDIKRASKPILSHFSASLWDISDGIVCLEFHSKMNTLDPSTLWVLNQTIQLLSQENSKYKGLIIYNEAKNFSLGANLGLIDAGFKLAKTPLIKAFMLSGLINNIMYNTVESMIYQGQSVFKALRNAPFPVIGAPNGMAIGGGCEILLHCDGIQASGETYTGLVDSSVGVVPGWGGCVRYLERCQQAQQTGKIKSGPVPPVREAFQNILMPQFSVSTSAQDAFTKHWLREGDYITMNSDRLLYEAKARILTMIEGYTPPEAVKFQLPGPSARAALNMAIDDFYTKGDATWHDVVVADALAEVLSGGETYVTRELSESDVAQLERECFLSLMKTKQTKKRIAHVLKTGKPLREGPLEIEKTLKELRATRESVSLTYRLLDGRPIAGFEAFKLHCMAKITEILMKMA